MQKSAVATILVSSIGDRGSIGVDSPIVGSCYDSNWNGVLAGTADGGTTSGAVWITDPDTAAKATDDKKGGYSLIAATAFHLLVRTE